MAKPRKYLPGYVGTTVLDDKRYPINGWAGDHDPGAWESTNELDGGWYSQESGIQKVTVNCTIMAKVADGIPSFVAGMVIDATFKINGVVAYDGDWFVSSFKPKPDLKGGVSFECTLVSQGPLTGSLVPEDLVMEVNTVSTTSTDDTAGGGST